MFPQPVFVLRAIGLSTLGLGFAVGAVGLVRQSTWLAPLSLVASLGAGLSLWAAIVQWVGSEKVDDHPWV